MKYEPLRKKICLNSSSSSDNEILTQAVITCRGSGGGDNNGGSGGDKNGNRDKKNSRHNKRSGKAASTCGRGESSGFTQGKRGSSTVLGVVCGRGKSSSGTEGVPDDVRGTRSSQDQGQGRAQRDKRKNKLPQVPVNISICDTGFQKPSDEFCPLRLPGPYLPRVNEVGALSLFELFLMTAFLIG